jgi:excisionase family DNA binding protein
MAVARRAIEDDGAKPGAAWRGRLALSKCEAADALGVSVDFLEEHVMHELRVVRRGRRRLIPVRELERWLDANASFALDPGPGARGGSVKRASRRPA